MRHDKVVEEVKKVLGSLNLPILPLTCLKSAFYTPDIITRVNHGFIPIDIIATKERVSFDIGGLALLSGKDIVDETLAIIDEDLWKKFSADFQKERANLPEKIKLIPFSKVRSYFMRKIERSTLWKPEDLIYA
jgi:hypothetical protein